MTPSAYAPYDRSGVGVFDGLRLKSVSRTHGVLEHALRALCTAPQSPFRFAFQIRQLVTGTLHCRPISRCVR
jgi:hypothetical protein